MTQKEIGARFYRKRIENGLCPKCGKPKAEGRYYCDECREKENQRHRKDRVFYQSIGICPVCKKNKLFGDEKQCIECREKNYARRKKLTEEARAAVYAANNERAKRIYAERAKAGICTRCGKKKAVDGRKKCMRCLIEESEKKRAKYTVRKDREERGVCIRCGGEMDRVGKICSRCAEKSRPHTTYDKSNHVWKHANRMIFKETEA